MGRFVNADGLSTYYEESGNGKPFVMLHGGVLNVENFASQMRFFGTRYRVVIPERRGHGRTPDLPGNYTYRIFAQDTTAFMDAIGVRDALLLGESDGANVALEVAVMRPDLVARLVLVSGDLRIDPSEERKARTLAMTVEDFRKRAPAIVESYERITPKGKEVFPAVWEKLKILWTTPWQVSSDDLGRIIVPTLVMLADRDFTSVEDAATLSRMISKSQLCVVPGASHGLLMSKAELANMIIQQFLETDS